MTRKNFWIPVGWNGVWTTPVASLHSNTLVLPVPTIPDEPFVVERIRGSWSPHVPEKHALYRVAWGNRAQDKVEAAAVRLATLPIGRTFLVPLHTDRQQTCLNHKGQLHGIFMNQGHHPWTNCGEDRYFSSAALAGPHLERAVPTCSACLTHKAVWNLLRVFSYEDKRAGDRQSRKERAAEERRLRLPTVYARILDDDLFDNPTYKPIKPRIKVDPETIPDPDDEFADSERDRKRASAIERSRRFEASKARVQRR